MSTSCLPARMSSDSGVAGTVIASAEITISGGVVWDDQPQGGGASGVASAAVFALPTWQANSNVPAAPNSAGGRGVPDVAGDASPGDRLQRQLSMARTKSSAAPAPSPL